MPDPAKVLKTPLTRYNEKNRGIWSFMDGELKGFTGYVRSRKVWLFNWVAG